MRQARWWRWWLAGGVVATVVYFLLPAGSGAAAHLYEAIGFVSASTILFAVRLHRPDRRAMWFWFAGGQLLSVAGDLVYDFYADVLHVSPYPSPADIFYLASYPVTLTGLILLARRRTVADMLNAAIVATGLGMAFWIFVLHPIAAQSAASSLERFVSITYPTVDLILLVAVAGQFTAPGGRTPSTRMLGLATALLLAADVTFSVMTMYSNSDGHVAEAGFLLSYVFWAAAALHPSMGSADSRPSTTVGRISRLVALGACSLLAPALLLLPRVSASAEDRTVVTLGAIALFVLVIARMGGVMRQVQRMALHDELTGLANRWRLEQATPSRLIVLGLNGFKNVNDELGRPIGDRLLTALADRLRSAAPGSLVARLSGDEFAVVPAAAEDAGELADRLGRALRHPVTVADHELLIGVSVGVFAGEERKTSPPGGRDRSPDGERDGRPAGAFRGPRAGLSPGRRAGFSVGLRAGFSVGSRALLSVGSRAGVRRGRQAEFSGGRWLGFPPGRRAGLARDRGATAEPLEPAEVLRRAEVAMHAAKQTGESFKEWTPALDEHTAAHARLGAELRTALDQAQFRVVYQPVVLLPEGKVHAVEALVRWEHPTRGLVSPVQFVPVAEQNGLIVELGAWILHTACAQLVVWRAALGDRAPAKVSVNVSARQLAHPGFARTVAATLAATGLPASCLVVEVTETAVFEGGQAVIVLHELRALGVRIALDDFGTGHSSLGLLQTVPVDTLKVDKSFVDRITEAGRHAVIAEALIQVSAGLGLAAVAEGVETAEQAAALYRLGYRLLQGYHYGRPVADPDFDLVRASAIAAHVD